MGFGDFLRDTIRVERASQTADGAGGRTTDWVTTAVLPCRVGQLGSREQEAYSRDGYQNVLRIAVDRRIPRRQGHDRLDELINDATLADFRMVHKGRNMVIVGVVVPTQGYHDTQANVMYVDVTEYPMPTGWKDT